MSNGLQKPGTITQFDYQFWTFRKYLVNSHALLSFGLPANALPKGLICVTFFFSSTAAMSTYHTNATGRMKSLLFKRQVFVAFH